MRSGEEFIRVAQWVMSEHAPHRLSNMLDGSYHSTDYGWDISVAECSEDGVVTIYAVVTINHPQLRVLERLRGTLQSVHSISAITGSILTMRGCEWVAPMIPGTCYTYWICVSNTGCRTTGMSFFI
jgi:hypothetical protein